MRQSERDVERLVRENQKLVHFLVNRYLQRYFVGDMEREDLVSWGMIGLLQAARAWDPERSSSFSTLACKAIERMIIRGVRGEWKPEQAAATVSLDDLIAGDEPSGSRERFVDLLTAEQDVEGNLLDGETRAAVRSAVAALSPPQRRLIERHYYEDVPVARLAEELGISRQGLYARQRQALRQLRATLNSDQRSGRGNGHAGQVAPMAEAAAPRPGAGTPAAALTGVARVPYGLIAAAETATSS